MQIDIPSVTADCPMCNRRQKVDLPPLLTRSYVARCDTCCREFVITRVNATVVYNLPTNPKPSITVEAVSAKIPTDEVGV